MKSGVYIIPKQTLKSSSNPNIKDFENSLQIILSNTICLMELSLWYLTYDL